MGLQAAEADPREPLQRMLGAVPPSPALPEGFRSDFQTGAALHGPRTAVRGSVLATLAGEPRWHKDSLRDLARTQGNSAALLAAYLEAGPDFCRLFGNTFAAAVVDGESRRVLLALDRVGIETLAWSDVPGKGLVFGSSSEAVSRHPWVDPRLDPQGLFNFVFFHMIPSPGTVFANVRKLGPGELLDYRDGKASVRRHWTPRFAGNGRTDLRRLASDVHSTLKAAVSEHASEPTVGAFLSGGLDSSTVSGMLARVAGRKVSTFSIGFEQQGFDEMQYARIAARHFGADGREYYVTPQDVAETLPRVAATFDEPFGNSSAVPTFLCARFARASGITRLLAGDGGDEIFGGNERYAKQKVFDLYNRVPAALRTGLLEPWALRGTSLNGLWPARKLRSYVQQASIPMPERLQTWNFMYRTGAAAMFDPAFLRQVDPRDPFRLMSATYEEAPTDALVDRMLYFDWKFTLADNDLRKVGRMCELAGVKVSYPMLDDRVLDVSLRVPPEQKVRRLELRHFYKETMKDFLPHEIITKSKHGFGLPFGQWLKATPALQAEVYPAVEALKKRGIVRGDFIDNTLREFQTDPDASYFGPMIWVLAILEHWLQARRL
jgi:asparagine synthase (glutamine-hydrolysing)